jgi:hypothetical protein
VSKQAKATLNSAATSKATAQPADSLPAQGIAASQPGNAEAVEYDLPSASDIASHLSTEPAGSTDDDSAEADEQSPETEPQEVVDETTAPEPSPEAETETEETAPADPAEAPAEDPADAKPDKSGLQKRIDEITAAKSEAERQVAELREQLAAANHKPLDPTNPFSLVDTEADLDAAVEREQQFMEWIYANESNPEGADLPDGKGGTVHFDLEQIRQMKVNTYRVLRTADKRREFLRDKSQREAVAAEAYPWLRSTKDGLGAEVQQLIEHRPQLRQSADYRLLAADAVVGARLRQAGVKLDERGLAALTKGKAIMATSGTAPAGAAAMAAARTSTPPVRRTAPSPGRPGNLPPRLAPREAAARQAGKALTQSDGALSSVSDSIAVKLRW